MTEEFQVNWFLQIVLPKILTMRKDVVGNSMISTNAVIPSIDARETTKRPSVAPKQKFFDLECGNGAGKDESSIFRIS